MIEYPLHWYVFENDVESLKKQLGKTPKDELDKKDLRSKTPLELAVVLDHFDCAKVLVEHGADCDVITSQGWNLVQEAVSTGNSELIKLIMTYRDYQRTQARVNGIPELLNKLKQAPDFYVEMKWEFTSWIPLISKACPSDVYKIYKSGSSVRIDTTLVGFNGSTWERGNRSYLFQATKDGLATIVEIDHIKRCYHIDKLTTVESIHADPTAETLYEPDESVIQTKLTSPNIVTFLDIEKIEFERNRSGIWGWRTDKNEMINGYDCKVYTANNLQLVTKTRVEHLNSERAKQFLRELQDNEDELDKNQQQSNLPGFLTNIFQGSQQTIKVEKSPRKLTALEYFQKQVNVNYYLNGSARGIDENHKIQTFNATLSLCETYPLSLHEQVLPIVDLMALNNSHFKKLKEFITLQLPSGFPVKIEIPIYRVITAKVTFGNIHGLDQHVDFVTTIKNTKIPRNISSDLLSNNAGADSDSSYDSASSKASKSTGSPADAMCMVDERIFKVPGAYRCKNYYMPTGIDPSLIDTSEIALETRPSDRGSYRSRYNHYAQGTGVDEDDILLQLAIQQSLAMSGGGSAESATGPENANEDQLTALEMLGHRPPGNQLNRTGGTQSLQEYHDRGNRLLNTADDDLMLQRVLAESLMASGGSTALALPAGGSVLPPASEDDADLLRVLEMSKREEEERERRYKTEEEELQKILELSLMEK